MSERWADAGEAERMAMTLSGDRAALQDLLVGPRGRESLGRRNAARAPDFLRNFDAALATLLDSVRESAVHVSKQLDLLPVDRVSIVGIPNDPIATASLGRFADGTAIIRFSDSVMGHLATLGQVVDDILDAERSGDHIRIKASTEASVASLRFTLLAQRCADTRITVPRRAKPKAPLFTRLGAVQLSPLFVLAHELGHEAYGHPMKDSRPDAEYEADLFGLTTLLHMQKHLPKFLRASERTIGQAVALAVAGIDIEERGLWVHVPPTHPSASSRLEHLTTAFPQISGSAVERCERIFLVAAMLEHMLPTEWWDALRSHRSWRVDLATILPVIAGLDQLPAGDLESDVDTLRGLTSTVEYKGRSDIGPMLAARDLASVYATLGVEGLQDDLMSGTPLLYADACDEVARGLTTGVPLRQADWGTRAVAAVLVQSMLR